LHRTSDLKGAEKEYSKAAEMDPTDPEPHLGLGYLREGENQMEAALEEYRLAERLDGTSVKAHLYVARLLLAKKDAADAVPELKQAVDLDPTNSTTHSTYAEALEASGNLPAAIEEFKETLSLDPKQIQVRDELATALEKRGDWLAAIENFRKAAVDDPVAHSVFNPDAEAQYEAARERLNQHIAALRTAGKSAEASNLEARIRADEAAPSLEVKLHSAEQAGQKALAEKHFGDAVASFQQAIELAGKLQPLDGRLPEAVGLLGGAYSAQLDYKRAEDTFRRQLALSEKIYGPQSPMLTYSLKRIAMTLFRQKDYDSALSFILRTQALDEKIFGENSQAFAEDLRDISGFYIARQDYAKAESNLLRSQSIYEKLYGTDSNLVDVPLAGLCDLYDRWSKPDKAVPCYAREASIAEKQFGPNSAYLLPVLTSESKALRLLGRNSEADQLQKQMQSIQSSQSQAQTSPN
jgi:tetratricopeptide (TPR) repeat protein